jgi:hypothetical protein
LDDALKGIASLKEAGVDYVIVGGVALLAHGIIRATEDIDVFIRPEAENVERLRRALKAAWNDPAIDEIRAEDLCGEYPAVSRFIRSRFGSIFGRWLGTIFHHGNLLWGLSGNCIRK